MSQTAVRDLFNFSDSEFIYDSFQCKLGTVYKKLGCLFCCEHFFCFYSNVMGMKYKEIIPLTQVKSIKLTGESIIVNTYKSKAFTFSGFGQDKQRIFSLMNSIHTGDFFDSQNTNLEGSKYDSTIPENLGQKFEDGSGIRYLTLNNGLDKTVSDVSLTLIPCNKDEIGRLVFDEGAIYSIRGYYSQLGYSGVSAGGWREGEGWRKERVVSYGANFETTLGGLDSKVRF
jgi:hypothetical protein